MKCYCDTEKTYKECCQPYLSKKCLPNDPLTLMRSRYSAYCSNNFLYLQDTIVEQNRYDEDIELLYEHSKNTIWLKLQIVTVGNDKVEFKAYYKEHGVIKLHHEISNFVFKDGRWLYVDGEILNTKIARNEKCACGSGKKYKSCCAKK